MRAVLVVLVGLQDDDDYIKFEGGLWAVVEQSVNTSDSEGTDTDEDT